MKEDFDYFEQERIMNGETTPQEIIEEREEFDLNLKIKEIKREAEENCKLGRLHHARVTLTWKIEEAIEEFIERLKEERNTLFRTIENAGKDKIGFIKKEDWDRFIINSDKLSGVDKDAR